ncbi:MAG: peroxiredoxin [Gammaproteobacteria bacterium]|nr:peroxiredoxin [Gammaproteobacteria bacterium]
MLEIGSKAPDFTLPSDRDGEVSLTTLLKNGPVLLYFYPADFTPGCTKEACNLRDQFPRSQAKGMSIAGVSPQGPASHAKFRAEHQLPFILLSDEDKRVIKAYDANGPLGIGVRRVTYLIDQDGTIKDAVLADFRIGKHKAFVESLL